MKAPLVRCRCGRTILRNSVCPGIRSAAEAHRLPAAVLTPRSGTPGPQSRTEGPDGDHFLRPVA